ncbi:MAG: hypothetical protein EP330_10885 [Deltaproteobacteria bacterium]|nr:MAG: hypothetical protein EP330_10885 [Deltaproteobacteria bacterium]
MISLLVAAALAGPTYGLAHSECELSGHRAELSCKKGVCVLEEQLTYYKPDCNGQIAFESSEVIDPLVRTGDTWSVAEPCPEGRCVDNVPNRATIRRVLTVGLDGSLVLDGKAEVSVGSGLTRTGSESRHEIRGKAPKGTPKLKPLPEASGAVARTPRFGGPLEDGLRHGLWLVPHPDGHPLVREVEYDHGVRVRYGEWEARTRTDANGRSLKVDELAGCPAGASIETALGTQLTQSCVWKDEDGDHALVASFDVQPWTLRSLERVRNGKRSGESRYFDARGQLERREHFQRDKRVGLAERFHANGALSERIDYREDGTIASRELYAANGQVLERTRNDVPGMADQEWSERYDPTGRLLEARVPLSAAVAERRTWTGTEYAVTTEERPWTTPETGCAADLDCPGGKPEEHLVGVCDAGVCRKVLDPAQHLKDRQETPLRDPTPLLAKLQEAVGAGRSAWINPNLVNSPAHTCIEVRVGGPTVLDGEPTLAARTAPETRRETEYEVTRWAEVDLTGGLLTVRNRASIPGEEGPQAWPSPPRAFSPLALSRVDAKGAHYELEVYDLRPACAPLQAYAACAEGAEGRWGSCPGEYLTLREPKQGDPPRMSQERPPRVEACEAKCPPVTCEAEAARLTWHLRDMRFQRPHTKGYALWWTAEDCARSIGL